jgi:hypothetical protein
MLENPFCRFYFYGVDYFKQSREFDSNTEYRFSILRQYSVLASKHEYQWHCTHCDSPASDAAHRERRNCQTRRRVQRNRNIRESLHSARQVPSKKAFRNANIPAAWITRMHCKSVWLNVPIRQYDSALLLFCASRFLPSVTRNGGHTARASKPALAYSLEHD